MPLPFVRNTSTRESTLSPFARRFARSSVTRDQARVELALRQQLAIYARRHRRPQLLPLDRAFWVALSQLWPLDVSLG